VSVKLKSVGVFCGSSMGAQSVYAEQAKRLGHVLAEQEIALVYGGGCIGLMGVVADAALTAGGKVIGVIPKLLYRKEIAHEGLTQLHVVETMAERKQVMSDMADAFITLPGGIGTLDELTEVWTWTQLSIHNKPCGLLNVNGFFDSLLAFIDAMIAEQFLSAAHRDLLCVEADPERLLVRLQAMMQRDYCCEQSRH
jgi:uncharacterized protein (TIGR00730 family)